MYSRTEDSHLICEGYKVYCWVHCTCVMNEQRTERLRNVISRKNRFCNQVMYALALRCASLLGARVVCILVHESFLATNKCCAVNPLHMHVGECFTYIHCM